jgi:hypothetical protein
MYTLFTRLIRLHDSDKLLWNNVLLEECLALQEKWRHLHMLDISDIQLVPEKT